jgi:3,4-dehydroadipyl-CoA semialdehyde dehydrogenase
VHAPAASIRCKGCPARIDQENSPMKLANYVSGKWIEGKGDGIPLIDPVTGEELARATSDGIDLAGALDYARNKAGPALRAMSYAERGGLLRAIADALTAKRDEYFDIALRNSGNTKIDAAIDIDGGIGTLKYYASVAKGLGAARCLRDPGYERLGKDEAFQAMHLWVPMHGVGVHINAFNFPSWGMWEKAAVAILAGVPAFVKPATSTCLLTQRMVKDVIDAAVLPDGALSVICGGGRALADLVTGQDAVAFTGSADTARQLRANANVITRSTRVNIEADSLNLSLLGPDANPGTAEFDLFVKEVAREMTVKAGQKCTAIRRALVPAAIADAVTEALSARLAKVVTGNPRNESVRMGPLVNKAQQQAALEGIRQLAAEAGIVVGDAIGFAPVDADPAAAAFVPPTLLRAKSPLDGKAIHEVEVFGPVCTVMPYRNADEAYALAARGGGSLAASVFTGDDAFATDAALGIASMHGRILVIDAKIAEANTGHGIVMPMCVHGGPGRAGGGEELGGKRGLRFYHQRVAVQASTMRLDLLAAGAVEAAL